MRKRTRWAIAVIATGMVTAAAAGGIPAVGNPPSRSIALADAKTVGSGIRLDDCPLLTEGYRGGCVSQLQAELRAYDHANLTVDDVFGEATRRAVISFQREHNIDPADGKVGSATKAALDAVAAGHPAAPASIAESRFVIP